MSSPKHASGVQSVLESKDGFAIASAFWSLLGQNARSNVDTQEIIRLFSAVSHFLGLTDQGADVSGFVFEQLYLWNVLENELVGSQAQGKQVVVPQELARTPPKASGKVSEETELTALQRDFAEVTFESFFKLMATFGQAVVLTDIGESFVALWEYLYARVVQVTAPTGSASTPAVSVIPNQSLTRDFPTFGALWVEEAVAIDKTLIYERELTAGVKKRIPDHKILQQIGHETHKTLSNFARENFRGLSGGWTSLRGLLSNPQPILTFFCVQAGDLSIQLTPAVFRKHLFEEVMKKGQPHRAWVNMLDPLEFVEVDHLDRFNMLVGAGQNPYYLEKIEKFGFEVERKHLGHLLNLARAFAADTLKTPAPTAQIQAGQHHFLGTEISGIEEALTNQLPQPDILEGVRTGNYLYDRLLELARQKAPRILLTGKPHTGKTKIAAILAKIFKLELVDPEKLVADSLKAIETKSAELKEKEGVELSPEDQQAFNAETEALRPDLEELERLANGEATSPEFTARVLQTKLKTLQTVPKGFIIDFSSALFGQSLLPLLLSEGQENLQVEYVVHLKATDQTCLRRALYQREARQEKEGVVTVERMGLEEQREAQLRVDRAAYLKEAELPDPIKELLENLEPEFKESLDNTEALAETLKTPTFESGASLIEELQKQIQDYMRGDLSDLTDFILRQAPEYFSVEIDGLSTRDVIRSILGHLRFTSWEFPQDISDAGSIENVLEAGKSLDAFDIRREWSFYKSIDPVEFLDRGNVRVGLPEFAVSYYNYAFVFSTEENKRVFTLSPAKYLQRIPKIEGQINLLVLTPENQTVREQTRAVAADFGLQFLEFSEYILKKAKEIEEGKEDFLKAVRSRYETVNLTFADLFKGLLNHEPVSPLDVLKLLALELGVPLELKFDEEEEAKILAEKPDPKGKKKVAPKALKSVTLGSLVTNAANVAVMNSFYERMRGTELPEEALKKIPAEPLVPAAVTPIKGFALYNLAVDQEILDFLSQIGLEFHKVFSFYNQENDTIPLLEENPREVSVPRLLESFGETRELLKTAFPETVLHNIEFNRDEVDRAGQSIADAADPFREKIDSDDLKINYNFESAGPDVELARLGVFGNICPIKLTENEWFVPCKPDSPSLQINGDLYRFSTEEAREKFRLRGRQILSKVTPVLLKQQVAVQRRIFLAGSIGSGLTTVARQLSDRLKIPIVDLKKTILADKKAYIQAKLFSATLRKGFNVEEVEEQTRIIAGCKGDVLSVADKYEPENPEADEQFEEESVRKCLVGAKGSIVVLDLFFSEEERLIFKGDLKEMISKTGLVPDNLICLRAGDFVAHNRIFHPDSLKARFEAQKAEVEARNQTKIEAKRQELFLEKQKEDPEAKLEDVEVGEADIEAEPVPVVEEEVEKQNTGIREKRERQNELINDLLEWLKEAQALVRKVNSELPLAKVVEGCLQFVEEVGAVQSNHFARSQFASVTDNPDNDDLSTQRKLQKMVSSTSYAVSNLGRRSLTNPKSVVSTFDFNVIHRGQIYFFGSEEEKKQFLADPVITEETKRFKPTDLEMLLCFLKPIFGKTLRKKLKESFGFKIVSLEKAVRYFFQAPRDFGLPALEFPEFPLRLKTVTKADLLIPELSGPSLAATNDPALNDIHSCLVEGRDLSDEQKVQLVTAYLQLVSLEERGGIILEDFPQNLEQFKMLRAAGFFPNLCFTFGYGDTLLKQAGVDSHPFFQKKETLNAFVQQLSWERRELEEFLNANFANLFTLNAQKSTEGNFEIISEVVARHLDSLAKAIHASARKEPFSLNLLPVSRAFLDRGTTELGRVCLSPHLHGTGNVLGQPKKENLVYSKGSILSDPQGDLLKRGGRFYKKLKVRTPSLPLVNLATLSAVGDWEAAARKAKFDIACPVCLSQRKAVIGKATLVLSFNASNFFFCSLLHLHKFLLHPAIFAAQRPAPELVAKVREKPAEVPHEKQAIDELTIAMNHICKLKLKYPTLTVKETALHMLSIFMKCRNPFKDEIYRRKYQLKLDQFISHCQTVDRLAAEIDQSKKEYKNFEMKLLHQRLEEFLGTLGTINEGGKENHLRNFNH